MRYELKGSNTLYKVWGIITYIFTGLYGVFNIAVLVFIAINGAKMGSIRNIVPWGIGYMDDYWTGISTAFVLGILLGILKLAAGLTIRILAGLYLVRDHVKSKGALITVSVFYFLIALGDLALAVFFGILGADAAIVILFYLFCTGWAVATGVFLIVKQAGTVAGGSMSHGAQSPNGQVQTPNIQVQFYNDRAKHTSDQEYRPYEPAQRPAPHLDDPDMYTVASGVDEYEMKACIEGLFGDYVGRRHILRVGESCRIGRDQGCDIQLRHAKISRIHCAVKLLPDGRFEVTDHSYNGTFYENKAIPNGVTKVVEAGGMLALSDAEDVFSLNIC